MRSSASWLVAALAFLVVVAGCAGSPSVGAPGATASPNSTHPGSWSVVALGDSVPAGSACGCTPYPELNASSLSVPGTRPVVATNDAAGGATTSDVLASVSTDPDLESHVAAADVVEIEVGANDVSQDRLEAGKAIQTIASGTTLIRLMDRDPLNTEVAARQEMGVRVLSRRNIEAYLLDDEVLTALCAHYEQIGKTDDVIQLRERARQASVSRGNDPDDLKKAAGEFYSDARKELTLSGAGSTWNAFAKVTLAPLVRPGMSVYQQLKDDIFGS